MANEGIELDIYPYSNPNARRNTIEGRVAPSFLDQLNDIGGMTFQVSVSDPKIVRDPSLLDSRNVVKIKVNGLVVGAGLIIAANSVTVTDGERSAEVHDVTIEGTRTWLEDAEVHPYGGLKPRSFDTRFFNFASERGFWYDSTAWKNVYDRGVIGTQWFWADNPQNWPEIPSHWYWSHPYDYDAGLGTSYFRYEFTTTEAKDYVLYAAGDNELVLYVDGQQVAANEPGSSSFVEAAKIDITLEAGNHVIGYQVTNTGGPAGIMMALYSKELDVETLVTYSGGDTTNWKCLDLPAQAPGWSAGEIVLTLIAEAEDRGVLFPVLLTPTFTPTEDSNGVAWESQFDWSFGVGETIGAVVKKIEELGAHLWIDPATYELHMVHERGIDRSVYQYDVDGITVISSPIIFEKGKNLRSASTQSRGKIKNKLSIKTNAGWLIAEETETESAARYGVIEGSLSTDASPQVSEALAKIIFRQKALEEEGASYEVIIRPGDPVPFKDYDTGDWVLAPDKVGLQVKRRILSISVTESDAGKPVYTLEFDTIFQSNEERLAKVISSLGGGGVGGGYSNSTPGGGNVGQPVVITPPVAAPIKIPVAPGPITIESEGSWSPNGVTPISTAHLTWDPVVLNTDGTPLVAFGYEVWAHLTSSPDTAYQLTSFVTQPEAYIQPFEPGSQWTFKVLAKSTQRDSSFSPEASHVMDGPDAPMQAPSTPTMASSRGILNINWDGLLNGNAPPPQFRYAYAQVAPTDSGPWTQAGPVFQRNTRTIGISSLTIGQQYWSRLIAVDGLGIASEPSGIANHILTGIDLGDLDEEIQEAIDAASEAAELAQDLALDAFDDAAAALLAANGKNKVIYSADPASGDNTAGDTWFQVADNKIIAQWQGAGGTSWIPRTLDNMVIANLDAGKLTTGFLDAARIAANLIVAEMMAANSIATVSLQAQSVAAENLAVDAVRANHIKAGEVQTDHLQAGLVTVDKIAPGVGGQLNLEANASINLVVGQINQVADDQAETSDSLQATQTYYGFGPDGAVISSPTSPYQLMLRPDRIDMLENGVSVSHWSSGQMYVRSFVGEEVVLGNHKIEKYGDGTVVRAL